MRKLNKQSSALADTIDIGIVATMFMTVAVLLCGCETVGQRDVAMPPPAFDPSAYSMKPMHTVFYLDADPALIEPAAGETVALAHNNSCRSIGNTAGVDPLSYRWGVNSFGLGFGSAGSSRYGDDGAQAALRYSFSLQPSPSQGCGGGNSFLDDIRSRFAF